MTKPFAITLDVGSSLANRTGSWRTTRPVYLDRLPPCNDACPAGENIQAWLFHAEAGDYRRAWEEIMKNNPLPAIMGRACYHSCESACNRGKLDHSVGIHAVERFLGDHALAENWLMPITVAPSGKTVAVIGAGPSGLSAAYHLTRMGHAVTVFDAFPAAGGMLRYGIPRYRLPRHVLDGEIARIEAMGVVFRLGTSVPDLKALMKAEGFDAAYLALGAQKARLIEVAGDGSVPVRDAIGLLHEVEIADTPLSLGKRVVVYGGGNVAMDAARSARRLGAEVRVIVREARSQMPAHEFEIREALEEGVRIDCLLGLSRIAGGRVVLERMVLDDTGTPRPTGEIETIPADLLIQAVGQQVETALPESVAGISVIEGAVRVDAAMMTGVPGIFAGGDMVPSPRTMTAAIGHGKKAAKAMDSWLRAEPWQTVPKPELAGFDRMNPWYYGEAPPAMQPMLGAVRRQSGFEEVLGNLDEDSALYEARRCLSCGNCFECDNCYGVCPDNAITKLGPGKRFAIKYDYCKGCGLCAAECPCGAIKMVAEEI